MHAQPRCGRWFVNEISIEPDIPVFDKSARDDGTFSREDFQKLLVDVAGII
jgi:hypothetical protein